MKTFFRNNGLSLTLAVLFLVFLTAYALMGCHHFNSEQRDHGRPTLPFRKYVVSGHFLEALFENWESEFLQMGAYMILTVYLFQKGSAESNDPERAEVEGETALYRNDPEAPGPVRRGGFALKAYERSLSLVFFAVFLLAFIGHVVAGTHQYNQERAEHGQAIVSWFNYLTTSRFWFESMQNWQSEFLALLAMVVLSIWLRQKGSPQSKKVSAPHRRTGE